MSADRRLRKEEVDLIAAMLARNPKRSEILSSLSERLVEDMQDGGMGSLRFKAIDNLKRHVGNKISEAEFTDEDGVLVSAVLNLDEDGKLFELDLWKVDFTALKRYPRPKEVCLKSMTER